VFRLVDHDQLVTHLLDPKSYPHRVARVDHRQTHISDVFLTGRLAYKINKPVNLGFLDFTSLAKRERNCREEHRLNRRLAPSVYLGVAPVTLTPSGLEVGGQGEIVEWAVVMRQMDERLMGPALIERGELDQGMIDGLVKVLVPFYQEAATGPGIDDLGRREALRFNTDENFEQAGPFVGLCLSENRYREIQEFNDRFLEEKAALFRRRVLEGRIREGHGDLHLANICFEEPPIIYDRIEFNLRFRCSDVAADLAFLAMDLDFNGRPDLGRRLVEVFVRDSGDLLLPELMSFYKCYRAFVRAKIQAMIWDDPGVRGPAKTKALLLSKRYFSLAHGYAGGSSRPVLVVLHGLMGSGKSALGRWLWGRFGWPVILSDVVRKKLAGLPETSRVEEAFGQGLYSAEMTGKVYEELLECGRELLGAGVSVVLDASFQRRSHRQEAEALARETGAGLIFIKTFCGLEAQKRRLGARSQKRGPSDGRLELMERQREVFESPGPAEDGRLIEIRTEGPKKETRARAEAELKKHGIFPPN
jgi:aminoglycoside phosphotransferase family enzyme/predicted kinase